jgi:hypothetical protein
VRFKPSKANPAKANRCGGPGPGAIARFRGPAHGAYMSNVAAERQSTSSECAVRIQHPQQFSVVPLGGGKWGSLGIPSPYTLTVFPNGSVRQICWGVPGESGETLAPGYKLASGASPGVVVIFFHFSVTLSEWTTCSPCEASRSPR